MMKELKEKVKGILKQHNIKMMVYGCGCCNSPIVTFEIDGVKIVENAGDFDFDMFEDEKPNEKNT